MSSFPAVAASPDAPSSSTSTAAAASNQPPPASFSLTTDPALVSSVGNTAAPPISTGRIHDLSGVTLIRIRTVMSQKEWSGDVDDKFIKRLVNENVNINEALAVLVHYHNDTKMDLAARIDGFSGPKLIRLCLAIGLVCTQVSSGRKKDDVILLRKQIMDFVLLYVNKYPSLVMSNTPGPARSKSHEEAKVETSEGEETDEDESEDEPVTPPPSRHDSSSNVNPRSSPRTTKGVRELIAPPGSKSTVRRTLDLPSSKSNQPIVSGLPADVLSALGSLPNRRESDSADRGAPAHKSKMLQAQYGLH